MPREQGDNQSLAARFKQRANELHARPYVPYGTGARAKANELLTRSKRGQRLAGQNWDLRQFPDDELRLARDDRNFAAELLRNYDPSFKNRVPTAQDIVNFQRNIDQNAGLRLFPNLQNGQNIPRIDPQNATRIREGFTARLSENRGLEQQAQTALSRADRLAPLNPLHTTARTLIEGNNPRESINLGREEIAAARGTNIPNAMAPYLERASQTPANYMTQYMQRYQPLMQNFREEARRDFLEHDMPTINRQFAGRGAFYSSARQAALRKAIADKDARITREIRNLTVHGQEQAMKDFNAERGHHLRQAEVAGSAHGAQREANIRAAEALRVNALSGHEAARQQAADLSHMGNVEQRQEQNQRDIQLQEHEREQRHPQEQAMLEAAILNNVPPGSFQMGLSTAAMNPPPPNPLSALGGAFAQMAGLNMQQPQQQKTFARGGHVRQGYAEGDSVKRAAAQLAEMKNHVQESPEVAEMRQSAQSFKNHNTNPMGDYLFSLGTHMLGNLQEDPMKAYAQGSNLGMQAYKQAQSSNLSAQEKYNNLMDKINQTKMYQHDFISKHHGSMLQHEEMLRHHKAQEAEGRRGHDIANQHYKDKLELSKMKSTLPVKKTSIQQKLEDKALENIIENNDIKNDLGLMEESLGKSLLGTGPRIGPVKSFLGIDDDIDALGNHLVTKVNKLWGRGAGSNLQLKTLQSGKPSQKLSKKANDTIIKKFGEESDKRINKNIAYLLKAGWSPEEIKKATSINIPENFLQNGEEENEENISQKPAQESQDKVRIIDPDGQPWLIPHGNVEAALQAGGQLAQ